MISYETATYHLTKISGAADVWQGGKPSVVEKFRENVLIHSNEIAGYVEVIVPIRQSVLKLIHQTVGEAIRELDSYYEVLGAVMRVLDTSVFQKTPPIIFPQFAIVPYAGTMRTYGKMQINHGTVAKEYRREEASVIKILEDVKGNKDARAFHFSSAIIPLNNSEYVNVVRRLVECVIKRTMLAPHSKIKATGLEAMTPEERAKVESTWMYPELRNFTARIEPFSASLLRLIDEFISTLKKIVVADSTEYSKTRRMDVRARLVSNSERLVGAETFSKILKRFKKPTASVYSDVQNNLLLAEYLDVITNDIVSGYSEGIEYDAQDLYRGTRFADFLKQHLTQYRTASIRKGRYIGNTVSGASYDLRTGNDVRSCRLTTFEKKIDKYLPNFCTSNLSHQMTVPAFQTKRKSIQSGIKTIQTWKPTNLPRD